MDTILVVNAGSSSLKFQAFSVGEASDLDCLLKGQIDGVGVRPRLQVEGADKTPLIDETYAAERILDLPTAIHTAGTWLRETQKFNLIAVGHHVVHGGPDYDRPVLIDWAVLAQLERYIPLSPLHQPNNLELIRSLLMSRPTLLQVACFDTAFHRNHSAIADPAAAEPRERPRAVARSVRDVL